MLENDMNQWLTSLKPLQLDHQLMLLDEGTLVQRIPIDILARQYKYCLQEHILTDDAKRLRKILLKHMPEVQLKMMEVQYAEK